VVMIDGRVMDDDRVDQMVKLGDTEAWTNTDQQYHSFHIHQTPFVTEVNGVVQDADSLRTPCRSHPQPTSGRPRLKSPVRLRTQRSSPASSITVMLSITKDKGMMGTVLVVA